MGYEFNEVDCVECRCVKGTDWYTHPWTGHSFLVCKDCLKELELEEKEGLKEALEEEDRLKEEDRLEEERLEKEELEEASK